MRVLLLVVMIALLPLRGWTGDAMAMGMALEAAAQHRSSDDEVTPCAHGLSAGSAAEHMPPGTNEVAEGMASVECQTCSACQICHTVAMATDAVAMSPVRQAAPRVLDEHVKFVSAESRRDRKPPIS